MSRWAHAETSEEDEPEIVSKPSPLTVAAPTAPVAASNDATKPTSPQDARDYLGAGFSGFMSGIKFTVRENELDRYLRDNGCNVKSINYHSDREGRFSGNAVIDFVDEQSMRAFLALNDQTWNGIKLHTKPNSAPRREDRGGRGGRRGDRNDRDFGGRRGDRDRGDRGDRGDHRGDRGDRGDRDRSERGPADREARPHRERKEGEEEAPKERPKIALAPRTLPVGDNRPDNYSSIFGGGRPHDELEYERKKAAGEIVPAPAPRSAAPASGAATSADGSYVVTPPAAPEGKYLANFVEVNHLIELIAGDGAEGEFTTVKGKGNKKERVDKKDGFHKDRSTEPRGPPKRPNGGRGGDNVGRGGHEGRGNGGSEHHPVREGQKDVKEGRRDALTQINRHIESNKKRDNNTHNKKDKDHPKKKGDRKEAAEEVSEHQTLVLGWTMYVEKRMGWWRRFVLVRCWFAADVQNICYS